MIAGTTIHPLTKTNTQLPAAPIVLIDSQPCTDLRPVSMTTTGPLDLRNATLAFSRENVGCESTELTRADRWFGREAIILQPISLAGGESRLLPLMFGRINATTQHLSGRNDQLTLRVTDHWQSQLEQSIELDDSDDPWTVESLLDQTYLDLNTALLSTQVKRQIVTSSRLSTVERLLKSVLQEHGLVFHRRLFWSGHRVVEYRTVLPADSSRPVRLGLSETVNPAGAVTDIRNAAPLRRPLKQIAEAHGQIVESTFDLIPGWDSSQQSLADSEYTKSTSSDFDAVANVFRLWVLNEDGLYTGDAFDLATFFNDGQSVDPQPLRFDQCLTHDAAERNVGTVVDASTDNGTNWFRYGGTLRVLNDRAGIYLDDDALPNGWITAVRAGLAKLRITATLQSPLPVQVVQWRGNPFADAFDSKLYQLGNNFGYRRISPDSIFYTQVDGGERTADLADDRDAMATWLAGQPPISHVGTARITTVGLAMALRISDQLQKVAGRSITLDSSVMLERITHYWNRNESELQWRVT